MQRRRSNTTLICLGSLYGSSSGMEILYNDEILSQATTNQVLLATFRSRYSRYSYVQEKDKLSLQFNSWGLV